MKSSSPSSASPMASLVAFAIMVASASAQRYQLPNSCDFHMWHIKSEKCIGSAVPGDGALVLQRGCNSEHYVKRFPKEEHKKFTLFAGNYSDKCLHTRYGYPRLGDGIYMLWHDDNCFDNHARLLLEWHKNTEGKKNGFRISAGRDPSLCIGVRSNDLSARLGWTKEACTDDTGVFTASCDGQNPFTETTTTTTKAPPTTITTVTSTSATDTILERLEGNLEGVTALLESQIVKYDKHVQELQEEVEKLKIVAEEAKKESDMLKAELSALKNNTGSQLSGIQSSLSKVSDGFDIPDAPTSCYEIMGDESDTSIAKDGENLDIHACQGEIRLRSKTCAVNVCRLQEEVREIQARLDTAGSV